MTISTGLLLVAALLVINALFLYLYLAEYKKRMAWKQWAEVQERTTLQSRLKRYCSD
jgi:predicted outer membrane lipoprotein